MSPITTPLAVTVRDWLVIDHAQRVSHFDMTDWFLTCEVGEQPEQWSLGDFATQFDRADTELDLVAECGTACCLYGASVLLDGRELAILLDEYNIADSDECSHGANLLGIDRGQAQELFARYRWPWRWLERESNTRRADLYRVFGSMVLDRHSDHVYAWLLLDALIADRDPWSKDLTPG